MESSTLSIIMYHYVRPIRGSRYPLIKGLELEGFCRQLDFLQQNYHVLAPGELIAAAKGGRSLPHDSCLLTFDDGYKDHYEHVFPELLKRGLKGCFFPPVAPVTHGNVLDVNKIHFILAEKPNFASLIADLQSMLQEHRATSGGAAVADFETYWHQHATESRFDSKEVVFFKRMLQYVLPDEVRAHILRELFARYVSADPRDFASQLYMSMSELREMVEAGMYVGAHGYSHVWLNKQSIEVQSAEIDQSRMFLSEIGALVEDWIMCYPYGGYNRDTLELLASRKCLLGLTTRPGMAELRASTRLELSRFDTNDFPQ